MTLEEYVEMVKKDLDEFESNWKNSHESDPENWPMEMNEGNWDEQLLSYKFDICQ